MVQLSRNSDLAAPVFRWHADDGTSFVYHSGNVIHQWLDKSGNNRTFVQSTSTISPLRSGTQNGRPVLLFDGADDYMDTAAFTVAQPITVFIALNWSAADNNQGWISSVGGDFQFYVMGASVYLYCGIGSGISSGSAWSGAHLWRATANGATSSVFRDGVRWGKEILVPTGRRPASGSPRNESGGRVSIDRVVVRSCRLRPRAHRSRDHSGGGLFDTKWAIF